MWVTKVSFIDWQNFLHPWLYKPLFRVRAGAEVIDRRLEVVVPVAPHELTPNSHQGGTYSGAYVFSSKLTVLDFPFNASSSATTICILQ